MGAIRFDTLQFVQHLIKAGIDEQEAEAVAEAVRDVQDGADVATKKDLAIEIGKIEIKIVETKADLIRRPRRPGASTPPS